MVVVVTVVVVVVVAVICRCCLLPVNEVLLRCVYRSAALMSELSAFWKLI